MSMETVRGLVVVPGLGLVLGDLEGVWGGSGKRVWDWL